MLEPRAREVMSELTVAVGRPMVHDLRAKCEAMSYVVKNGVEWPALPVDFPPTPWEAVYAFFERSNGRGLPLELVRRLRELLRRHQGQAAQPTACGVDSRMGIPDSRRAAHTALRWLPRSSFARYLAPVPDWTG